MPETLASALLDRFAALVGDRYALRDPGDVAPFLSEPRGLHHGATPLVLRPGSVGEVSRILRLATETGTAIVPQGGNTGLVGGQVPDASGRQIVLSLSRLDAIRELDPGSNTVTAEAGVVLARLQEAAEQAERLFPLNLASQGSCQLGGILSTNAGGTAVLAYGSARDLCLGVEVVLPTGEVLDDLRKLRKDNTGYGLKDLFVGAEGTLGVITAAVMKLVPRPRGREVAWAGLNTPAEALALLGLSLDRAGGGLTAFELIGETPLRFALRHGPVRRAPLSGSWPWHVLLEVSSGRSREDAASVLEEVLSTGLEAGLVGDAVVASSLEQQETLWLLRESMSDAQRPEGGSIKHDVAVPVAAVPDFIEAAHWAVHGVSPAARVACFGHLGDGNLHFNVSQPEGGERDAFLALYLEMNAAVHAVVRRFGGSFSAEHGIGRLKRAELIATTQPLAVDLMRRIKAAFDPAGIMNPGKVV